MQRIRLWTTSLVSRMDGMVSRIENHEALAQSAIRGVRQAAARANVQLRRVREDGDRQRRRLDELREAEVAWRDRARAKADEDEAVALECLRRSKEAARRGVVLARRVAEHERVEAQLASDVAKIDERLAVLEEQRNVLVTRQSRAEALSSVRQAHEPVGADPDEIFGRWETRVAEREYEGGCFDRGDVFEEQFTRAEEDSALRAELAALRESEGEGEA
jgi:phage shock protein A